MQYLERLTDDAKQRYRLLGALGQNIDFALYYMPTQQSWFFNLGYNGFVVNGVQLVAGLNVLRNYKNLLNFGLACLSGDGQDPYYLNDFVTGRIKLFLLNQDEVNQAEAIINETGA